MTYSLYGITSLNLMWQPSKKECDFSQKFCLYLSVLDPACLISSTWRVFFFYDLNYQLVLCSMLISEHVFKQGG